MPDAARKYLKKYDETLEKLSKSPADGEHSAVQHLRRLLEQNDRLREALGSLAFLSITHPHLWNDKAAGAVKDA